MVPKRERKRQRVNDAGVGVVIESNGQTSFKHADKQASLVLV